jgi:hypothetical protein
VGCGGGGGGGGGGFGGSGGGGAPGGEMTQALYAHMNKKKKNYKKSSISNFSMIFLLYSINY